MKTDYLIVGAGLAGLVLAERLASQINKKVLLLDKRQHVGGNCYDYFNDDGILVHKYGPHYFRTNFKHIFDYLSNFTEWHYTYYRVRIMVDGKQVPLPINLDTINELYGRNFSSDDLIEYFHKQKLNVQWIRNSEDTILSKVGHDLYEKIYKNYTIKQWGVEPKELDASVCERIPVRTNRDGRYFTDKYQAMPKYGYFKMFSKMLNHPNIRVLLNAPFEDVKYDIQFERMIWTGPIDDYFGHKYGQLPYRSLYFEHETLDMEYYQPVVQINYPHDYDFTRVVEIKHVTNQKHRKTAIVREYPATEGEPYYPIPRPESRAVYSKYKEKADKLDNVYFVGRLAEYQYMNMDQVVDSSLKLFEKIKNG